MKPILLALLVLNVTACSSFRERQPQTPDASNLSVNRNVSDARANTAVAPPMDPKRRVAQQDCRRPVVFDQGNLRCG